MIPGRGVFGSYHSILYNDKHEPGVKIDGVGENKTKQNKVSP